MFLLIWLLFFIIIPVGVVILLMKTIKFVFAPLSEATEIVEAGNIEEDKPQKVIIKDNNIDVSRIKEYTGEEIRKFEFRPQTWKQFIAQDEAKMRAKTIMKKVKRGIRSHLILSAIKGHGKTTFIELLAKDMNAHLIQRVGKQVDEDSLVDIINEINTVEAERVVLFIDEIDSMDWKVIKILNPIIEQFKINDKKIRPFIFACATINKHLLIKTNPDTLDRIPHHIQFSRYKAEDIKQIIAQYKNQLYNKESVSENVINVIASSCKFNPRTGIALLEDYVVEKDIQKVLTNCHIIKNGLTKIDINILEVLNKSERAMGANAVAMRVGLGQNQYLREYEPFLYEFGYINRTPSRTISDKGKRLLQELK